MAVLKKFMILAVILVAAFVFAVSVFSRKAPEILRVSIEKALGKEVKIRSIEYRFPWRFELRGFEVLETKEPFVGEQLFYADGLFLNASPLTLSQRSLVIDRLEVEEATIVIRLWRGKPIHALSAAAKQAKVPPGAGPAAGSAETSPQALTENLPFEIGLFKLSDSHFKFIDYDVQESGFVVTLDQIQATIRNIKFPLTNEPTAYKLEAVFLQGRDDKPARLDLSGETVFASLETDALCSIQDLSLPYFKPYYSRVTPAFIERGYADSRIRAGLHEDQLDLSVDFEIRELLFQSYELDDQLFGLKADEILAFLKDSSGRLKFQIAAQWNIADRSVKARDVIRRAIEQSLKRTVLTNVGNLVEKAFQTLGAEESEKTKDKAEAIVSKVKDLLKFG